MTEYKYIAYIDEAGDFGLRKVSPIDSSGASEWLMVSGVVIRGTNEYHVSDWLRAIRLKAKNNQAKSLHFRTLKDRQKKIVCEEIASLDVRLFVVISNKINMRRHHNYPAAFTSSTKAWFYWWMCRLLLERMTEFCENINSRENTPDAKLRLEFSRRKDLKYKEFISYLRRLQAQGDGTFLDKRIIKWSVMDLNQIHYYNHGHRAGLQLADAVASSFYQAVNRDNQAQCDPQFAKLLMPRIWKNTKKQWFDSGFTVFPFPLKDVPLDEQQKDIFHFYGYPLNKLEK